MAIGANTFKELALSFPHTEEVQHFERKGYKVVGRRMFASYLASDNTANVFLTPAEQRVFCKLDKRNIFPVPNKWGEKGATTLVLDHLDAEVVMEALSSAYAAVTHGKSKGKGKD